LPPGEQTAKNAKNPRKKDDEAAAPKFSSPLAFFPSLAVRVLRNILEKPVTSSGLLMPLFVTDEQVEEGLQVLEAAFESGLLSERAGKTPKGDRTQVM
jgi:hypothetical protein